MQSIGSGNHKDVDGPQIAVQQGLRTAELLECACALRQFPAQDVQPLQQPIVQWRVRRRRRTRFKGIDRVADVRFAKVNAQVAAVQPHFSEQRMPGEARVKPCNQLDRCAHALAVDRTAVELTRSEVVVDMPDAAAAALGDAPEQCRAVIAHADGRQPAFLDQLAAARDRRAETFDDHLARVAIDIEAQAEDARRARLQHLLPDQAAVYVVIVEQLLQQAAKLDHAWLAVAFQQFAWAFRHVQLRRSALSASIIASSYTRNFPMALANCATGANSRPVVAQLIWSSRRRMLPQTATA